MSANLNTPMIERCGNEYEVALPYGERLRFETFVEAREAALLLCGGFMMKASELEVS